MIKIPQKRREQAYKAFRVVIMLSVILSIPIGIAAAQTAEEPEVCSDGPPIRGDTGNTTLDIEVVMVNDISSSIGTSGLTQLKEGNKDFISELEPPDEVGAVSYSYLSRIDNDLTTDYDSVNSSIDSYELENVGDPLTPSGETQAEPAISDGTDVLLNRTNASDGTAKAMVIFTDGIFSDQSAAEAAAQQARENGITVFVIGLGDNVEDQELITIAGDESRYYSATEANLTQIYNEVSVEVRNIERGLSVETRDLYLPGQTHEYTVYEIIDDGTTTTRKDVTANATIEILSAYNGTLLSANTDGTLTAVNDDTVSDWARVNAEYNSSVGCTNVVVSQPTVQNIELVPGIWRLNALIGDSTIYFILLATLGAVSTTRFTSAFGGLAIGQMILVVGWLGGYVAWAFAASSVFVSMFIGLNLAANIDYSVGKFRP